MANVSKAACEARKAFRTTNQWCMDAMRIGTLAEYQIADQLRQEAYEHMRAVLGAENPWTPFHEGAVSPLVNPFQVAAE